MRLATVLGLFLFVVSQSHAADLSKIERRIAKEPAYQTKTPKYCLLVFGPEANNRVWIVQDGDTLYVDRNGNGDLTEDGERVKPSAEDFTVAEGSYYFKVGEIRAGERLHKGVSVGITKLDDLADRIDAVKEQLKRKPGCRGFVVQAHVEIPGWKGTGVGGRVEQLVSLMDGAGFLQFADRAQDAPMIHFGGPWQILRFDRDPLTAGRQTDLVLGVGTPGVGPGSTAWIAYEKVIPKDVYPKVEITYPSKPGETPVKEIYELKHRC